MLCKMKGFQINPMKTNQETPAWNSLIITIHNFLHARVIIEFVNNLKKKRREKYQEEQGREVQKDAVGERVRGFEICFQRKKKEKKKKRVFEYF